MWDGGGGGLLIVFVARVILNARKHSLNELGGRR